MRRLALSNSVHLFCPPSPRLALRRPRQAKACEHPFDTLWMGQRGTPDGQATTPGPALRDATLGWWRLGSAVAAVTRHVRPARAPPWRTAPPIRRFATHPPAPRPSRPLLGRGGVERGLVRTTPRLAYTHSSIPGRTPDIGPAAPRPCRRRARDSAHRRLPSADRLPRRPAPPQLRLAPSSRGGWGNAVGPRRDPGGVPWHSLVVAGEGVAAVLVTEGHDSCVRALEGLMGTGGGGGGG